MVGEGWLSLTRELERELQVTDPDAEVTPTIAASGLLQLKLRSNVIDRRTARAVAREWEARAAAVCEACGGSVQTVRVAAPGVVNVICAKCARDAPRSAV